MAVKSLYLDVLNRIIDLADNTKLDNHDRHAVAQIKDLVRNAGNKSGMEVVDRVSDIFKLLDAQRYFLGRWLLCGSALYERLKRVVNDPGFKSTEISDVEAKEMAEIQEEALESTPAPEKTILKDRLRDLHAELMCKNTYLKSQCKQKGTEHWRNTQFFQNPQIYYGNMRIEIDEMKEGIRQLECQLEEGGVDLSPYKNMFSWK